MISLNDYENILYISPILKLKLDFSKMSPIILCDHSKKFLHIRYVKIKIKFLRRRLHRIIVSFSNHFPKKLLYIRYIEIEVKTMTISIAILPTISLDRREKNSVPYDDREYRIKHES